MGLKFLLAIVAAGTGFAWQSMNPWLVTMLVACALALDTRRVVAPRNVVVIYHALLLGLGPYIIKGVNEEAIHEFGAKLAIAFLLGMVVRYGVGMLGVPGASSLLGSGSELPHGMPRGTDLQSSRRSAQKLLWLATVLQLIAIANVILTVGLGAYLSGAGLVAGLDTYAQGGLGLGDIMRLASDTFSIAAVAVYASTWERSRPDFRLLGLVLVILPLLQLQRGSVVTGLLVMVLLYAEVNRRFAGGNRGRTVSVVVLTAALMIVVGLSFGLVRATALGQQHRNSFAIVQGEFSPVIVVSAAVAPGSPPRYGGQPLVEAFVTRFVPRRVFPNKPDNTTARFMKSFDPAAERAGYSLATTGIGAIVLNFGRHTAYLVAAMVGGLLAGGRADVRKRRDLGPQVIIYCSLYTLMRNDPVNSLTFLLLTLGLFNLMVRAIGVRFK